MAKSSLITFNCPSCGHRLAGIKPVIMRTQVVKRTCAKCTDRWLLVVRLVKGDGWVRISTAKLSFLDNTYTRKGGK